MMRIDMALKPQRSSHRGRSANRKAPLLLALCSLLASCATAPRTSFTVEEQKDATINSFQAIRAWGDATFAELKASRLEPPIGLQGADGSLDYLALSGGGSGGAFGAGLLVGWSKSGTRPRFDVVSGVSTGALIAPFAFLGERYDPVLTRLYTSGIAESLPKRRPLPAILTSTGLVDPQPLRRLIEQYADSDVIDQIADEHRKGRRLLVVTTNLDAQRPVVWDMGAIASSGQPGAMALFQNVLLASASIPAVFPPVEIDVSSHGRSFREMHADGGTTTQVFTLPDAYLSSATQVKLPSGKKANLYVVVNNTLMPEFEVVKDNTIAIASRAYSTLIKTHIRGSIYATYAFARGSNISLHLAAIDQAVPYDATDPFNTNYMRTLFGLGYDRAIGNNLWNAAPLSDVSSQNLAQGL